MKTPLLTASIALVVAAGNAETGAIPACENLRTMINDPGTNQPATFPARALLQELDALEQNRNRDQEASP